MIELMKVYSTNSRPRDNIYKSNPISKYYIINFELKNLPASKKPIPIFSRHDRATNGMSMVSSDKQMVAPPIIHMALTNRSSGFRWSNRNPQRMDPAR